MNKTVKKLWWRIKIHYYVWKTLRAYRKREIDQIIGKRGKSLIGMSALLEKDNDEKH